MLLPKPLVKLLQRRMCSLSITPNSLLLRSKNWDQSKRRNCFQMITRIQMMPGLLSTRRLLFKRRFVRRILWRSFWVIRGRLLRWRADGNAMQWWGDNDNDNHSCHTISSSSRAPWLCHNHAGCFSNWDVSPILTVESGRCLTVVLLSHFADSWW